MPERRHFMTMRTTAFISNEAAQFIRGKVLDVGAGDAPYKRLYSHVVDEWQTLDARPVADHEADMDADYLQAESFDTVLCTDALQYSRDPKRAIESMAKVLKPGGALVLTAPNCWYEDQTARWRFTIGGLGELVQGAGLTICHLDGLNGLWSMEADNASLIGEYASAIPATFQGFIDAMDKTYPMITAVIATK